MTLRQGKVGILVVDDSPDFLRVACSWLETQPELHLVGTATNGAQAIDAVARQAPDLVIMDAFMPVMDGFAATRAIKTRAAAPWVVMVSVHEGATMEREAWAAGADAFVVKSSFAEQMLDVVRALRSGAARAHEVPAPRPVRRPEDAPLERREIDDGSWSARAVRRARRLFVSIVGAEAPAGRVVS